MRNPKELRRRRGFTLMEILVAFCLVGLVSAGIVESITQMFKYRRRLEDRVRMMGVQQRMVLLLSSRPYLQDVLLRIPANKDLADCLGGGYCPETGDELQFPEVQSEPNLPPLVLRWLPPQGSVVIVQGHFRTDDAILGGMRVTAYFDLFEFPPLPPAPLPPLNCGKGQYLAGVATHRWTAECKSF